MISQASRLGLAPWFSRLKRTKKTTRPRIRGGTGGMHERPFSRTRFWIPRIFCSLSALLSRILVRFWSSMLALLDLEPAVGDFLEVQ